MTYGRQPCRYISHDTSCPQTRDAAQANKRAKSSDAVMSKLETSETRNNRSLVNGFIGHWLRHYLDLNALAASRLARLVTVIAL